MNSAGCSQGLQLTVLWTFEVSGLGFAGVYLELLFWYVGFHEGLQSTQSCYHSAPSLSILHTQPIMTFRIKGRASPLYCCLFYKVRDVFLPTLLKEGPLCFPFPVEVIP